MSIGQPEYYTQKRIIALFRDETELPLPRRLDRPGWQQQYRGRLA